MTLPMKNMCESIKDVLAALPKIDGWKPESVPMDLNSIGQNRLDAKEIGEISAEVGVEDQIEAPGREIAEYRHRLNRKRRQLIRSVMSDLIAGIDGTLRSLNKIVPRNQIRRDRSNPLHWEKLKDQIQEIETLLGSGLPGLTRWS